jgi:hypothetical protein
MFNMKTIKQSTFLLTGLLLLAFTSCKKIDVATSTQKSVPTAVSQNESATQTHNFQDNFDLTGITIYDDCTGEIIDLSGTYYSVFSVKLNNNKETSNYHENSKDVKGTGETTNNAYTIVEVVNVINSYDILNNTETFGYVQTFKITTAGANNNFYIKYRLAFVYDIITDTYTIEREKFDSGCQ